MKLIALAAALFIITNTAASQNPHYKESLRLSKNQKEVVTSMGSGDKLYKTLIGYQLVTDGWIQEPGKQGRHVYDSRWIHRSTFKSLKRRRIIEQADKNPKNKGYGEYILTEKGEEINHNLTS